MPPQLAGLVALVVLFMALAIPLVAISRQARWRRTLRVLAAQRGLLFTPGSAMEYIALVIWWLKFFDAAARAAASGQVGAHRVEIDHVSPLTQGLAGLGPNRSVSRIRLRPRGLGTALQVERRGAVSRMKGMFLGGGEVRTGDPAFDEAFVVRGDELTVATALDGPARAALGPALEAGAVIHSGELVWVGRRLLPTPGAVSQQLDQLVEVADQLTRAGRAPERLLARFEEEESAAARHWVLDLLLRRCGDSPACARACALGLEDSDRGVRILAATGAGTAGASILLEAAADAALLPSLRARAIEALPGTPGGVPLLAELLAAEHPVDDEELAPVHSALARAGLPLAAQRPAAQALCLALLQASDEDELRVALIEALAAHGDALAVEPLMGFSSGLLLDDDIKTAARGAIQTIQERLGTHRPGGLSVLAEEPQGGLSVLEGQAAGGLSLQQERAARLQREAEAPASAGERKRARETE